jgi:hypothetical protein
MAGSPLDESRPQPSPNDSEDGDSHKEHYDGEDYPADPTGSTRLDAEENGLNAEASKSHFASVGLSTEDALSQSRRSEAGPQREASA